MNDAIETLSTLVAMQNPTEEGKHNVTSVTVHRTRSGKSHKIFLLPIDGGRGARNVNLTPFFAKITGTTFNPSSGGIVFAASWQVPPFIQTIEEAIGTKLNVSSP